jgi:hypothetical protein
MSIGNTKTDGNKGNNFPYQHNVLKGLQAVLQDLQSLLVNTTGVQRRVGIIRPTAAGDVNFYAAQFYSVSVANTGLANGALLGSEIIRPGEILNFSADSLNNYFNTFAYDATGTDFLITFVY